MIRQLKKREIGSFLDFGDSLYRDDPNYVPFIRLTFRKTLEKLVFEKKTYTALCSFDEKGRMNGRVLLTVGKNKQLQTEHCGYFSHFEAVNDQQVFDALMERAALLLKEKGAEYMLGSFFPHDPDDRRGIVVQGFELAPMLFASHNPAYYPRLFEQGGFEKLTDAYEYEYREKPGVMEKIERIAEKAVAENDIYISPLDMKHLDRELEDVHTVMERASTKINFEDVLPMEELVKVVKGWKRFIRPEYALIARRNSDGAPIGFTLSVPDYCELIRKMRGRLNVRGIGIFLFGRKKIRGLRAVLQYVVPEYQHKGVSKALYMETKKAVEKNRVERISLGTIMEKNINSNGAILSLGGELSRVYRIYYKKI